MGNTIEVTTSFRYFATLPYRGENIDIKKLDSQVIILFGQIKKAIKNKKVKKHLFYRGFTSKQLISWSNCLINKTINYSNMDSYSLFAGRIKNKIDLIGYVEPLPVLYQYYRSALLKNNKAEASRQIYSLSLLLAPYAVNLAYDAGTPVDTVMLKTVNTDLESLESSYINTFFPGYEIPGTTLISGLGVINSTRLKCAVSYKVVNGIKYYNIPPQDSNGNIPVIYSSISDFRPIVGVIFYTNPLSSTGEGLLKFSDYVSKYLSSEDIVDGEWYNFSPIVFPSGDNQIVFTDDVDAHGDFRYPEFFFRASRARSVVIYNNAGGVKVETDEYIYYTSQPGITTYPYETVTSYTNMFDKTLLNTEIKIAFDPVYYASYALGPYGYFIQKDFMDLRRLNSLLTRFGLSQNEHVFV